MNNKQYNHTVSHYVDNNGFCFHCGCSGTQSIFWYLTLRRDGQL